MILWLIVEIKMIFANLFVILMKYIIIYVLWLLCALTRVWLFIRLRLWCLHLGYAEKSPASVWQRPSVREADLCFLQTAVQACQLSGGPPPQSRTSTFLLLYLRVQGTDAGISTYRPSWNHKLLANLWLPLLLSLPLIEILVPLSGVYSKTNYVIN